jgi:SMP-30/gluconolaconase/LRE-like protein
MMSKYFLSIVVIVALLTSRWDAVGAEPPQFPQNATFKTLITTPRAIEGLTGDGRGNLYTGGSGTAPCPVWQISLANPSLVTVGLIPNPCGFSGIAFNDIGDLFVADGGAGTIYTFTPNATTPPTATVYALGVPGTNGIAFDRNGNLWTGDGTTGQGRVWEIAGPGANCAGANPINCQEVFRIQPMANEVNLVNGVGGVGRDVRDLPLGTITVTPTSRNAANTLSSQAIVANGIAFNHEGDMLVIDTARGALWKVEFDRQGNLKSPVGCDTTFTSNTLCLSNVFVAHPILEGGDGIALDVAGNIWVDANERNAVGVVTKDGRVAEVFRNPVNSSGLRNSADPSVGNNHILEFPTSPFLSGKLLCTSNSDGDRRDNSPRSAGEIDAGGAGPRGKISCMEQEVIIPGLPLPLR